MCTAKIYGCIDLSREDQVWLEVDLACVLWRRRSAYVMGRTFCKPYSARYWRQLMERLESDRIPHVSLKFSKKSGLLSGWVGST